MRTRLHQFRLSSTAPVYLAAVLEALTAELLRLAGDTARKNEVARITPAILQHAVRNSAELDRLLSRVTLRRGGTPPDFFTDMMSSAPSAPAGKSPGLELEEARRLHSKQPPLSGPSDDKKNEIPSVSRHSKKEDNPQQGRKSQPSRAGLHLPVGGTHGNLNANLYNDKMITNPPMYLMAVPENLMKELLSVSGDTTRENKVFPITPAILQHILRNGTELGQLLGSGWNMGAHSKNAPLSGPSDDETDVM
ncbi:uncharacterized protein [Ranitomeya imitator]|uniref:uncharacterized protein n=1 Tax=Ranitomeya imitator TaxID=111125 RepID=UPI0037E88B4A